MMKRFIDPGILTMRRVLTPQFCGEMIERGEMIGFKEASVRTRHGQKMMKTIRDNERVMFNDRNLADGLFQKITPGLEHFKIDGEEPVCLNDYFRIYKYRPGQRFNQHKDGQEFIGGMISHVSVLFYLNDDYTGGETGFYRYVHRYGSLEHDTIAKVEPEVGSSLMFLHNIFHSGNKVEDGMKYVLRTDLLYKKIEDGNSK